MLTGRRILLIVGGGIAAYKSLDLVRRLRERGARVRCVLTRAGAEFVTPLSLSALSEDRVYRDLFDLTDESEMGHIQLSRDADLLVVAPATADLMAKMAAGLADDLASTVLLATDTPVLAAPAMNVRMYEHPATRRNMATLAGDGIAFVGPNAGAMACGEFGAGRMAEPLEIVAAVEARLQALAAPAPSEALSRDLAGRRILVTSGPTHEPIDPVRYIANRSSGKQGHAVAAALAARGAEVVLVSGPVQEPDPPGVRVIAVESARDMLAACEAALPVDAAVFAAAVADWRVASEAGQKIKKSSAPPVLTLAENPDILATISRHAQRPRLVVGFAAETENVVGAARAKRQRKGCDWIVANDVSPATGTFGGSQNEVHLISDAGDEHWPKADKAAIAARLAARIAAALGPPAAPQVTP